MALLDLTAIQEWGHLSLLKSMKVFACLLVLITVGCVQLDEPQSNFANPSVARLLSTACAGDIENLENLYLAPDDINAVGNDGTSPLLWLLANCEGSQDASAKLISLGADPHLFSPSRHASPATFAVRNLPSSYLRAMLEAGMDPNHRYENYADSPTLLFKAVMYRDEEKVDDLLRYEASLEARNASGDTPLLFIRANQWAIGRTLLKAGADAKVENEQGHDICYRLNSANYSPPEHGPDYKRLFVDDLQSLGIACRN